MELNDPTKFNNKSTSNFKMTACVYHCLWTVMEVIKEIHFRGDEVSSLNIVIFALVIMFLTQTVMLIRLSLIRETSIDTNVLEQSRNSIYQFQVILNEVLCHKRKKELFFHKLGTGEHLKGIVTQSFIICICISSILFQIKSSYSGWLKPT